MSELISGGITLMIMGMGTVFVFLTLLVFGTSFMSWIINKTATNTPMELNQSHTGSGEDLSEVAAVAAAARFAHNR